MDTLNPTYYWYDANGNMITRVIGGSTYNLSYDTETHLTGVSGAASATFAYDGDGKRVKGTVGGTTTVYIGNYFEWTGSTSTMKRYYYTGGTRIAIREGNTLSWLLGDHLGSTSITASASGARSGEVCYLPWGEDRYTWGTTQTTFRFTGQRQEAALGGADGLYFYGARWYDSYLNRWIQPDDIIPDPSNPLDWDRYQYVRSNPLKYNDPSGHTGNVPWDPCPSGCPVIDMSGWSGIARGVVTFLLTVTVDNLTSGRTGVYGDRTWGVIPQDEYIYSGAWSIPPVIGGVVGGLDDLLRGMGDDVSKLAGTLDTVDARKWYLSQEARIKDLIDTSLPLEERARQAFDLRNQFRTMARDLMADRELAERLMREEPNLTWDQVLQKARNQGHTGDDVYRYIIDSSQRSRPSVNRDLGLDNR